MPYGIPQQQVDKLLEPLLGETDLQKLLDTICKVGRELLVADGLTVFLLEPEEHGGHALVATAGDGPIGKLLLKTKARYYLPRREPLSDEQSRTVRKSLESGAFQIPTNDWDKECQLIEDGFLQMGLTAFVARTRKPLRMVNTPEEGNVIQGMAEHRGKFALSEKEKGKYELGKHDTCRSVIMQPIVQASNGVRGVVKGENKGGGELGFTPEDEAVLGFLAKWIALALGKFTKGVSYKSIFGEFFPNWVCEMIVPADLPPAGKSVAEHLCKFFNDTVDADVFGMKEIYTRVTMCAKSIGTSLSIPEGLLCVIDQIEAAYEPLLATDVSYRDHFVHQFHVFVLGFVLILKDEGIQKALASSVQQRDGVDVLDRVVTMWYMTAIFHDTAYVVERTPQWLGRFLERVFRSEKPGGGPSTGAVLPGGSDGPSTVRFQLVLESLLKAADYDYHRNRLTQSLAQRFNVNDVELRRELNAILFDKGDHGLLSALIVLQRATEAQNSDLVTEAALAIGCHSHWVSEALKRLGEGDLLEFSQFPLAYLLSFCDEAQEWGRPFGPTMLQGVGINAQSNAPRFVTYELVEAQIGPPTRFTLKVNGLSRHLKEEFVKRGGDVWTRENEGTAEIAFTEGPKNRPFKKKHF